MDQPTVEDIWAQVPNVECKGYCARACRVVGMSEAEFINLEDRIPDFPMFEEMVEEQRIVGEGNYRCPALTEDGLCSQYDVRPLVCRLYGSSESVTCPHGCVPREGLLSSKETSDLYDLMTKVGGPLV